MKIVHRKYLVSYGGPQWIFGYYKKLLDNPPCKKPGDKRSKDFSYEFETIRGPKNIVYLHLVGIDKDLDETERQLAKYKLARIERENELILILDAKYTFTNSIDNFIEFCREQNFIITGKQIHKKEVNRV
ncbi:MAG: hypothetical protein ACFFDN_07880 [Candidatus Hodarchaeota archaeon]